MTVEDRSDIDKVLKTLEKLSSAAVKIGILSKSGGEILLIANVNEYGCSIPVTNKMRGFFRYEFGINISKNTKVIKIPERSFVRSSFDENQKKLESYEELLEAVIDSKISVDNFYQIIGNACVNLIKDYIKEGNFEPNSPITLKHKRPKTKPLIDTGRLINSIDFEVIYV